MIITLLLGGLVPTISGQIERQKYAETRKQLSEIQEALFGFAIINGRLPCPADSSIPTITGVANGAGEEIAACGTSANGGVLPWVTLGIGEVDAWGRRFTYRVTPKFADTTDGTADSTCAVAANVSFQICSVGNLDVWSDSTKTAKVASEIPVVIISHGTDGLGASTTAGQIVPGVSGDQSENAVDNNNNDFVSHTTAPSFDDLVTWISPNIMISRMVAAGKLP